jgi:NAD(P)-dependent dehydrogenase (short-subunit alcohol dehydrogenase family)
MKNNEFQDYLNFSNKVVIITGASRGIGRAIAQLFFVHGALITLVGRDPNSLSDLVSHLRNLTLKYYPQLENKEPILSIPSDVSNEREVEEVVNRTFEYWGKIDILINNAGLMSPGDLEKITYDDWKNIIDVNLSGSFLYSKKVAAIMKRNHYGRIINISSISGQTGGASAGVHYSASKGGLISMTKTLARDLAPYGITVNSISPGVIKTHPEFLSEEEWDNIAKAIPLGRLGEPEDIAHSALFLASPLSSYITGTTIDVNGGMLKR